MTKADSVATHHEKAAADLLDFGADPRNPANEATAAAIGHALLAISARIADMEAS